LASLGRQKFDLMFLSLRLPDAPGDQIYKAAKHIDAELNIVVTAAHPNNEMLERILEIGPVSVLKKPVKVEHLGQLMKVLGYNGVAS
jgi:DNA-binding NtrC family response regulator